MRVSVVLPTRDRLALLQRAVESVRQQSWVPHELVVVNDGTSPVVVPGARVVDVGPGAGACLARNVGARVARGDWLAFLDDDDAWHPEYLAEAASLAGEVDLVLTAFTKVRASGEEVPEKVPPDRLEVSALLVRNPGIRGSNILVRREVFLGVGGFDESLAAVQDLDLGIRLADAGVRHGVNIRPRVAFHVHKGPRISTPGAANAWGNRGFLARHGRRMTADQVLAFRTRTRGLFECDPGPLASLLWVLGPPGAGKSTWAGRLAAGEGARVLELADLLRWRDGATVGVSAAKRSLVEAIRSVELVRPETDRRLLVVSALLSPEILHPLSPREHVVAIVPRREDWEARVIGREGRVSDAQERDYSWWSASFGIGVEAALRAGRVAT